MEEQVWWNLNAEKQFDLFKSWVGDENSETKIYFAKYLSTTPYKTIIDLGCGHASFALTLQKNNVNIEYTGVDTCEYFINYAQQRGIKIINNDIRNLESFDDNSVDVVFSRHTLEHQPSFDLQLNEMIRVAMYEAAHVFFIKPTDSAQKLNYDNDSKLFHNTYNKESIELFLRNHPKVDKYTWHDNNKSECTLHIYLNNINE